MKTEYSQGSGAECLTRSNHVTTAASSIQARQSRRVRSKPVIRRLDSLRAQINIALRPVMRRMNEHVHDHRAAVRIAAPLPRGKVPGTLQLLVSNLRQHFNDVVKRLIEQLQDIFLVGGRWLRGIGSKGRLDPCDLVEAKYVRYSDVVHLLAKSHFLGTGPEAVEISRHGIRHVERELLGNLPVADKLRHVEHGGDRANLGAGDGGTQHHEREQYTSAAKDDHCILLEPI